MPTTSVLRAQGLGVRLGPHPVVRGVDLALAAGERVALVGPSGSGKSMLVRALLGVLPVGAVRTGEVSVAPATAWVQQDSSLALHPSVSVRRQLVRPLRRRGLSRAEAREAVDAALGRVGLDAARVAAAVPGELSGGERQRVCLALAVLVGAELVLADEPTTALDSVSQAQVLDALAGTGAAVLLVTHDVAVAAALCHRVVVLADGAVVEDAPIERLLA